MFMKIYFCSMGVGFGGLSSPNKVTSAPKLNYETVQISGLFVNLKNVKSLLLKREARQFKIFWRRFSA